MAAINVEPGRVPLRMFHGLLDGNADVETRQIGGGEAIWRVAAMPFILALGGTMMLTCPASAQTATAAESGVESVPAAEVAPITSAASITASGITLNSVRANFPDSDRTFPGGAEADVINNNCLACHSAGMVLTQPRLSRGAWQAEVDKMRKTFKAPIAEEDVPAIVDYLAKLNVGR